MTSTSKSYSWRGALYWAGLLSIMVFNFYVKNSILNVSEVPPGPDLGNWLTISKILTGNDVVGYGFRHPPIFFLLLAFLLKFLDPFTALKFLGALCSTIIAVPFFLISRRVVRPEVALVSTFIFVTAGNLGESLSWGAYPQFLAIFFMLFALYYLLKVTEKPHMFDVIMASIFAALTVGTHHLTSFTLLFTLVAFILYGGFMMPSPFKHVFKYLILTLLLTVVFCVGYFPVYWNMHACLSQRAFSFSGGLSNFSNHFHYVFRDAYYFWLSLFLLLFVVAFFPKHLRDEKPFTRVILLSLTVPCIVIWYSTGLLQDRSLYFLVIPLSLTFAVILNHACNFICNISKHDKRKAYALFFSLILAIGLLNVFLTLSSVERLRSTATFYHCIGPEELEALKWLKENSAPGDAVLTSGKIWSEGASYGWWIQGLAERKAFMSGDIRWFIFDDERKNTLLANQLLFALEIDKTYELMKESNIKYVFLDKHKAFEYKRFSAAPQYFEKCFENNKIVIFRLIE